MEGTAGFDYKRTHPPDRRVASLGRYAQGDVLVVVAINIGGQLDYQFGLGISLSYSQGKEADGCLSPALSAAPLCLRQGRVPLR